MRYLSYLLVPGYLMLGYNIVSEMNYQNKISLGLIVVGNIRLFSYIKNKIKQYYTKVGDYMNMSILDIMKIESTLDINVSNLLLISKHKNNPEMLKIIMDQMSENEKKTLTKSLNQLLGN